MMINLQLTLEAADDDTARVVELHCDADDDECKRL